MMIGPDAHSSLAEVIPACLRQRRQWVVWRFVDRFGKRTKCPFDGATGRTATSMDSHTWSRFDDAIAAWQGSGNYDGVGFVFAAEDPFCGVDLDDCINPVDRELKEWARQILNRLDSYAEISPSGRGAKIFLKAAKPGKPCRRRYEDGAVEVYDRRRFFTVTGQRLDGISPDVEQRQVELDRLYEQLFGDGRKSGAVPTSHRTVAGRTASLTLSDEQILQKASRSRAGSKFAALWKGEWQGYFASASEADSSVVFTLAFYTKDADQIDRLFRTSGLMRSKWDEKRGDTTYGQLTIDNALNQVTEQYRPRRSSVASLSAVSHDDGERIVLGTRDPATGRVVLSPTQTLPTAEAFVNEFYRHGQGETLRTYAGAMMAWRGNRYVEIEQATLRQQLQPWLHGASRYVLNRRSGKRELVAFESNPTTIAAALDSIRDYTHVEASIAPPAWLGSSEGKPDPRELLPCRSGNLHVPTGMMLPPTPELFTTSALDFDYDQYARPPERWMKFIGELWEGDSESIELLQQWFGYCLTPDTSQQKMLLLVGPKRSGKGTIGRVLTKLVGAGNVVGPTTSSVGGTFGLQPLIGKSLAIVSDARFRGDGIGVVVERLLSISGEDTLTVDRKFLGSVTLKLPTRFMFLTNELPRLGDASAALASRFVILRLTRTFYGHEDVTLTGKLVSELPGILLWAIAGLRRLRERGHFIQPASGADAVQDMENLSSPVLAFVRERCTVGPGHRVALDDLYALWRSWCERQGCNAATTKQIFGRDLV